jgi:membrane protein YdbS with pleckstrin-like domain
MSHGVPDSPLSPDARERLILVMFRKRTAFMFNYVLGGFISGVGILGNIATAAGFIEQSWIRWEIGVAAILSGLLVITATELRRRFTLYIMTTWNVRIRTGLMTRNTIRVFYDEISSVETSINPEEKAIGIGDVRVYTSDVRDRPAIVFTDVYNPDGIREIILRFIQTMPSPLPWVHIPKARIVVF